MLSDKHGRVRYYAAWALTSLNQKGGIAKMLEILQSDGMEDLEEGFDFELLASSLKIPLPKDYAEWNDLITRNPDWKRM
jgi:hypothetical protein